MTRILAFSGSSRSGSFNLRLVRLAGRMAQELGAQVSEVDLRALALPIFDQDLEQDPGPPEGVSQLRHMMMEHDGFLVACPEYNGSITPLLKNAIDWVTRPEEGVGPMAAFRGKTATLLAASPGGLGGIRGLPHMHILLSGLGTMVLPTQVAVGGAHEAFTENDQALKQERQQAMLLKAVQECVRVTGALGNAGA